MNSKKTIYLILAVIGTVIRYYYLGHFLITNGFNIPVLISDAFINNASSLFGYDVVVSAIVLFVFMFFENKKHTVQYTWLSVLATCTVGVSCGLPLFLYFRELSKE